MNGLHKFLPYFLPATIVSAAAVAYVFFFVVSLTLAHQYQAMVFNIQDHEKITKNTQQKLF